MARRKAVRDKVREGRGWADSITQDLREYDRKYALRRQANRASPDFSRLGFVRVSFKPLAINHRRHSA